MCDVAGLTNDQSWMINQRDGSQLQQSNKSLQRQHPKLSEGEAKVEEATKIRQT